MIAALLILVALSASPAGASDAFVADVEAMAAGQMAPLTGWKFRAGDDPGWADPALDEAGWLTVDSRMPVGASPEWDGIGWFRLRVSVPQSFREKPLALVVRHSAASEIYVDGVKVASFGRVSSEVSTEERARPVRPFLVVLPEESHLIAVRLSNRGASTRETEPGFEAGLRDGNRTMTDRERWIRGFTVDQALLSVSAASFAVLHLFIYLFNRRAVEHFLYAVFTASVAVLFATDGQGAFVADLDRIRRFETISGISAVCMLLFALLFVYRLFAGRIAVPFYPLAISAALLLLALLMRSEWLRPALFATWGVFALLELLRVVVVAFVRKRPGSRIIGSGFALVAIAGVFQMLSNMGVVDHGLPVGLSFLALLILVSVHLSLRYAETNRELEKQLVQVRELSERTIAQEREAQEQQLSQRLLEADNARKTAELDRAREIQLAMLPRTSPQSEDLEVVFAMHTATEVGGDFYDYRDLSDGTTMIAAGDATGHGLDAGIVVAAAKSLLRTAPDDVAEALNRIASGICALGLRRMNMAMVLATVHPGRLRIAAGGMPPPLLVRADGNEAEELGTGAPPPGAMSGVSYSAYETSFGPGDLVLLMSDGLPETANRAGVLLGYESVRSELADSSALPLPEIIERLVGLGERWRGECAQEDDVTLVLIRRRPEPTNASET